MMGRAQLGAPAKSYPAPLMPLPENCAWFNWSVPTLLDSCGPSTNPYQNSMRDRVLKNECRSLSQVQTIILPPISVLSSWTRIYDTPCRDEAARPRACGHLSLPSPNLHTIVDMRMSVKQYFHSCVPLQDCCEVCNITRSTVILQLWIWMFFFFVRQ